MNMNNIGNVLFENANSKKMYQDTQTSHGLINGTAGGLTSMIGAIPQGISGSNFTNRLNRSTVDEVDQLYRQNPNYMRNKQAIMGGAITGLASAGVGGLVGASTANNTNDAALAYLQGLGYDGELSPEEKMSPLTHGALHAGGYGLLGAAYGAGLSAIGGHMSDKAVKRNLANGYNIKYHQ